VTFFEGDFSAASFSASKYDIIIASAIIEHVESPHDFLREAARLLKPNGQLFVLTPNTRSVTFRWLRSFWRELLAIGEHVYMFDQQSLERCARGSGLQLEGAVTDYDSARIDVKALRFTSLKHTCVSIFTVYIKVIKRLSMLLAGAQCGDLLIVSFRKRE
jgi:SAM-dependent methyltransferase